METTDILSLLKGFPVITLAEMEKVRLMNRIDTKYTIQTEILKQLLQKLKENYFVQVVNNNCISPYQTIYLDTVDLAMYIAHQNGRRTREKIRMRAYLDSQLSFLEIKDKNNKGRTHKQRIQLPALKEYRTTEASAFLIGHSLFRPEELFPQIENRFSRITLVNREKTERLTIDTNISFHNLTTGNKMVMNNLAIVELKQDGNIPSFVKATLHEMHVRPVSISKYCLGTVLTNPDVKHNRFKKKLLQINKLTQYGYTY